MAGDMLEPAPPITPNAPPMYALQERVLPLTDPSLQMKVSPWHPAMPPLRPLQGVFAACMSTAMKTAIARAIAMRTALTKRMPLPGTTNCPDAAHVRALLAADFAGIGFSQSRALGDQSVEADEDRVLSGGNGRDVGKVVSEFERI